MPFRAVMANSFPRPRARHTGQYRTPFGKVNEGKLGQWGAPLLNEMLLNRRRSGELGHATKSPARGRAEREY
jgi:hypothetical protein